MTGGGAAHGAWYGGAGPERRPTLSDVAELAGVSPKTASRALNGERHVHAQTAARVRSAAEELGFMPNRLAQGLRSGASSASVGMVIGDLANPFWSAVARGVEREVARSGLLLMTASHEEDPALQQRVLRALVERRIDGLVLVPAPGSGNLEPVLRDLPVVAVDRPLAAPARDEVLFDDRAGAATAVAAMIAHGHRRIAFVGAEAGLWTVQQRLAGYGDALARAGLGVDPALVRLDCPLVSSASAGMRDLLRLADPPTAVLAMNNVTCRGVLRGLRDAGADVTLTSFDTDPDAELFVAAPSTVVNDPEAAGRTAAQMLLDRIGGDRRPVRRVVLPAALVVRAADAGRTTGVAPAPTTAVLTTGSAP